MTSRSRWLIAASAAVIVVAGLIALGVGVSKRGKEPEPVAAPAPPGGAGGTVKFLMEQQWLVRMKLAQAQPRTVARQITSIGRLIPAAGHHAIVAPPVGGLITAGTLPQVGQQVARGQTLAVLRQIPTATELAQVEAGQAQVRASQVQLKIEQARLEAERRRLNEAINETRVRLDHAKQDFERVQRLYERKANSQRQLQAAEAEFRAAASVHTAAVAQRDALAPAGPDSVVGGDTVVPTTYALLAPISGTVVKVNKAMGAQVAPGEAVLEIINLETLWVEAPIFERDLPRLGKDVQAVFTTPATAGVELKGRLVDIGAVVNEQSRAVTVLFQVPNAERRLRVGMQANVRLDAGDAVQALIIPKEAVLEHEGKHIVYVLVSGEDFQRREILLGDEYGDTVAVLSGLKAGERVVTQGAYQMRQQELRPAGPGAHTHES